MADTVIQDWLINDDLKTQTDENKLGKLTPKDSIKVDNNNILANNAKVAELKIGSLMKIVKDESILNSKITQWNALTDWRGYGDSTVNKRILLYPSDPKITMGYNWDVGMLTELVDQGIGGKAKNLAENITQMTGSVKAVAAAAKTYKESKGTSGNLEDSLGEVPEFVSRLGNIPYFKGVTSSSLSSITFNFTFGQNYLFSAEEEVVKPIYTIANAFAPKQGTWNNGNGGDIAPIKAIAPGKTKALTSYYVGLFGGLTDMDLFTDWGDAQKPGAVSTTITDTSKGLLNNIVTAINQAGTNMDVTVFMVRLGNFYLGPFFPKAVSWEFENTLHNEQGLPTKGSITLGDLLYVVTDIDTSINSTIGYK